MVSHYFLMKSILMFHLISLCVDRKLPWEDKKRLAHKLCNHRPAESFTY